MQQYFSTGFYCEGKSDTAHTHTRPLRCDDKGLWQPKPFYVVNNTQTYFLQYELVSAVLCAAELRLNVPAHALHTQRALSASSPEIKHRDM